MTKDGVRVTDFDGNYVEPQRQRITWDPIQAEKGGFKHFMLKEIYEQPRAVRETVEGRISLDSGRVFLDEMKELTEDDFKQISLDQDRCLRHVLACGTRRQVHDRTTGSRHRRCRLRFRVSLSRSGAGRKHLVARDLAVGRNGRHHRRDARSERARRQGPFDLQRTGLDDHARSRRHNPDSRRTGDRRGFDQSLYVADDRALSIWPVSWDSFAERSATKKAKLMRSNSPNCR